MNPRLILPGLFVERLAVGDDPELAALAREAPMAYLSGNDHRVEVTDEHGPHLRAAARTMLRDTFYSMDRDGERAARQALLTLDRYAPTNHWPRGKPPFPGSPATCRTRRAAAATAGVLDHREHRLRTPVQPTMDFRGGCAAVPEPHQHQPQPPPNPQGTDTEMGLSLRPGRPAGPLPQDPRPQWSYTGFRIFQRALAEHIGIDLARMKRYGGTLDWSTVDSPVRHLLDHADDSGELAAWQARELAPALREALASLSREDSDDLLWSLDSSNGRAAHDLVALLEVCAAEDLPVRFG